MEGFRGTLFSEKSMWVFKGKNVPWSDALRLDECQVTGKWRPFPQPSWSRKSGRQPRRQVKPIMANPKVFFAWASACWVDAKTWNKPEQLKRNWNKPSWDKLGIVIDCNAYGPHHNLLSCLPFQRTWPSVVPQRAVSPWSCAQMWPPRLRRTSEASAPARRAWASPASPCTSRAAPSIVWSPTSCARQNGKTMKKNEKGWKRIKKDGKGFYRKTWCFGYVWYFG